jgi:hypothetical protein
MLSVTNKHFVLCVVVLNIVMLSVIMLLALPSHIRLRRKGLSNTLANYKHEQITTLKGRHDTHLYDIQHNDTQHNWLICNTHHN